MARKKKPDESSGGANWMDTYGDMVTLLLCFFVLLFSFSTTDKEKWQMVRSAFAISNEIVVFPMDMSDVTSDPFDWRMAEEDATDPDDGEKPPFPDPTTEEAKYAAQIRANFNSLYTSLVDYLEEHNIQAEIVPDADTLSLIIRFSDSVLFESGRDELLPDALPILNNMIDIFSENRERIGMVRVEGHTDNVPLVGSRFEDNWDLAASRALRAVRYIIESGRFDDGKIYAASYGEKHNIAPNDTPEGRQLNRRIDFVVESISTFVRAN